MGIFDCLFNMGIPKSTPEVIIVRPRNGTTFANGLAYAFDDSTYDKNLIGSIEQREYFRLLDQINDILMSYFPCCLCQTFGYLCCLPTLALSLCCPLICVRDAGSYCEDYIRRYNNNFNRNKGKKKLTVRLRKRCLTSWLEFTVGDPNSNAKNLNKVGSENHIDNSDKV